MKRSVKVWAYLTGCGALMDCFSLRQGKDFLEQGGREVRAMLTYDDGRPAPKRRAKKRGGAK